MKQGLTITELATTIMTMADNKRDLLIPTAQMKFDDFATLQVPGYSITPNSVFNQQMASFLDVPAAYASRLRDSSPALYAANMNHWLQKNGGRRLVRTINATGPSLGRAFLSDKYRALDNEEVAEVVLPMLADAGLEVVSAEVTDKRMYLKAVSPKMQGEVAVGDVIQSGIVISNSEVGAGALSVSPLLYRLACLNGMVLNALADRTRHVGSALQVEKDGYELLSDETRAATDRATLMQIRDLTMSFLSQKFMDEQIARLKEARGQRIESPANTLEQVVEATAREVSLLKPERGSVLKYLIEGGDLSRWGLANAITRTSQDIGDYDRATELEGAGAKVIDLSARAWNRISTAGVN